jgi:hypothetical protein
MIFRILAALVSLICLEVSAAKLESSFPIKPVPPQADFRVAVARIVVAPDRPDWTYKPGELVKFRVLVMADNTPVEGAVVDYAIGPELQPVDWKTVAVPTGGLEL